MAIKDLVSGLVEQKLINGYQVKLKQDNEWITTACELNNKSSMIIKKLNGTETKKSFQNQFKEYLSVNQVRIIVYYTSEAQKIKKWIDDLDNNNYGALIFCITEEKEEKFITKLEEIIG